MREKVNESLNREGREREREGERARECMVLRECSRLLSLFFQPSAPYAFHSWERGTTKRERERE